MSAEHFSGVGLAPGSVRGVRSFGIDKWGRLTGVVYTQVWTPGENEAVCRKGEQAVLGVYGHWMAGIPQGIQYGYAHLQPAAPSFTSLPVRNDWTQRYLTGGAYIAGMPDAEEEKAPEPKKPDHAFADCSCGFYGYFDGSDDYHDDGRVTAVVEAYGEAVIGTRGFRANKARIIALRVKPGVDEITEPQARKVRTNYSGIPMFDSFERMVSEFPADTHLEPSPLTDPDFWSRP